MTAKVPQSVVARVRQSYARIAEVNRPEIWISLRLESDVVAEAAAIDARVAAGEDLPLAGYVVAVKDNIDVAGLPTTAGCPAFRYDAKEDAAVIGLLTGAGALVLGKTNLDQFATGLVGTRSPYGAVRDAHRPAYISGGSSSGSAVAVALGLVDIGLATDTAGSGRVPAALQGIVGLKPTRGRISTRGLVPASPGLDCIGVFAGDLDTAACVVEQLAEPDDGDPYSRTPPNDAPAGIRAGVRVGVAYRADLGMLSAGYLQAYERAIVRVEAVGATVVEIDIAPFLAASALLYDGAFVAHRFAAVGEFIEANRDAVDPVVAAVILGARRLSAAELAADEHRLATLAAATRRTLRTVDGLMLPTTTSHPSLREVDEDPLGTNARLGVFTNFCNLLDLCAASVPAGEADGGPFGVSFFAPAFHDRVVGDLGALFLEGAWGEWRGADAGVRLAVFGAHLQGHPLNEQLVGGRLLGELRTSPDYRLFALPTDPPKPGLVRVVSGGAPIRGELWQVPPSTLAALVASIGAPLALGRVQLADGSGVVGFLCEQAGTQGAVEISRYGSWTNYLAADAGSSP